MAARLGAWAGGELPRGGCGGGGPGLPRAGLGLVVRGGSCGPRGCCCAAGAGLGLGLGLGLAPGPSGAAGPRRSGGGEARGAPGPCGGRPFAASNSRDRRAAGRRRPDSTASSSIPRSSYRSSSSSRCTSFLSAAVSESCAVAPPSDPPMTRRSSRSPCSSSFRIVALRRCSDPAMPRLARTRRSTAVRISSKSRRMRPICRSFCWCVRLSSASRRDGSLSPTVIALIMSFKSLTSSSSARRDARRKTFSSSEARKRSMTPISRAPVCDIVCCRPPRVSRSCWFCFPLAASRLFRSSAMRASWFLNPWYFCRSCVCHGERVGR